MIENLNINNVPLVEFKSTNDFYFKEKSGLKNNTVRKVDLADERFQVLKKFSEYAFPIAYIQIKNINEDGKQTGNSFNDAFCRLIKDVTFYENLVIVTWYI